MKKLFLGLSMVLVVACQPSPESSRTKDIVVDRSALAEKFDKEFYRLILTTTSEPIKVSVDGQDTYLFLYPVADYTRSEIKGEKGQLFAIAAPNQKDVVKRQGQDDYSLVELVQSEGAQYTTTISPFFGTPACERTSALQIYLPNTEVVIGNAQNRDIVTGSVAQNVCDATAFVGADAMKSTKLQAVCNESFSKICDLVIEMDLDANGQEIIKRQNIKLK
jgi:hypothetical protein